MADTWTERGDLSPTTESIMLVSNEKNKSVDVMMLLSVLIAGMGIVLNLTVAAVFLNSNKLRTKIPNMFIINQVRKKFTVHFIINKTSKYFFFKNGEGYWPRLWEMIHRYWASGNVHSGFLSQRWIPSLVVCATVSLFLISTLRQNVLNMCIW